MKIPVLEPLRVAPSQVQMPVRSQPTGDLGIERLGAQVGAAADQIAQAYQQEKHKAEVLKENDGHTELQRTKTELYLGGAQGQPSIAGDASVEDITKLSQGMGLDQLREGLNGKRDPGFLSSKGDRSIPAMDETLKKLRERRDEIADRMPSPESKQRFLKTTEQFMLHAESEAKGHVFREMEQAKVESEKVALATLLKDVATRPDTDPENEARIADLVGGLAARSAELSRTDEIAAAKVDAIRAEVAATRAKVLMEQASGMEDHALASKKWDAAEAVVKGSEKALGEPGQKMLAKIAEAREVGKHNEYASALMRTNRLENGQVDEAAVWRAVAQQEGETQKKLSPIVTSYLAHHRKAYEEDTKRITNEAGSVYAKMEDTLGPRAWKQFEGTPLAEELRVRDFKLYRSLREGSERELLAMERRAQVRANNSKAKESQKAIDKYIHDRWTTTITQDPKASLEVFMLDEGRDAFDPKGMRASLEREQAQMQKVREKGLLTSRSTFVEQSVDAAQGFIAARAGTRKEKDAAALERQDFEAAAGRAWDAHFQKHEQAPMPEDGAKLRDRIIREYMRRDATPLRPQTPEAAIRSANQVLSEKFPKPKADPAPAEPAARKIPQAARERAIERIRKSGKPVTEDLIYRVYDYEQEMKQQAAKKGKP